MENQCKGQGGLVKWDVLCFQSRLWLLYRRYTRRKRGKMFNVPIAAFVPPLWLSQDRGSTVTGQRNRVCSRTQSLEARYQLLSKSVWIFLTWRHVSEGCKIFHLFIKQVEHSYVPPPSYSSALQLRSHLRAYGKVIPIPVVAPVSALSLPPPIKTRFCSGTHPLMIHFMQVGK